MYAYQIRIRPRLALVNRRLDSKKLAKQTVGWRLRPVVKVVHDPRATAANEEHGRQDEGAARVVIVVRGEVVQRGKQLVGLVVAVDAVAAPYGADRVCLDGEFRNDAWGV